MTKFIVGLLVALALFALPGSASAAGINLGVEPPAGLIVNAGGLEWVYAGPCAPVNPSCGIVLLHHNFFIPSDLEWNAGFSGLAAFLAAFNIPGGPVPCAAPYFNVAHNHCDPSDANAGFVWGAPFAPSVFHRTHQAAEAFLVRGVVVAPEPTSMLLLGTGLVGAGIRRLRRRKAA